MSFRDFKSGQIIKHILGENGRLVMPQSILGKPIYAVVPPEGYIINKELLSSISDIQSISSRAFGISALKEVTLTINGEGDYELAPVKDFLETVQPILQACNDLRFKVKWDLNEYGDSIENVYVYDLTYRGRPVYVRKINAFDKVLVKVGSCNDWAAAFYSHRKDSIDYILGGIPVKECVLYEGNEHLLHRQ